ncbi:MAG: hypothetical protein D6753_04405 [Planctomycetota bacterium]|nr:MAG: hypothetical protein D6753_04405 [Planctomycetota bacterium]
MEIEVLDPQADPQGNPAVELRPDCDCRLEIDIPPVILVHRYYYSGHRSFKAQLLPGGPAIVVANHPATGQRCYVPVQMIPGAARVTYTARKIEYDFGTRGTTIDFKSKGGPEIRYRNAEKVARRIGKLLHADAMQEQIQESLVATGRIARRTALVTRGALVQAAEATKIVTVPIQNVAQVLPFGKALFSRNLPEALEHKAIAHQQQQHELRTATLTRP